MKKRDKREIVKTPKIITELFKSLSEAEKRYNELVEQYIPVYFEVMGGNYVISLETKNGN